MGLLFTTSVMARADFPIAKHKSKPSDGYTSASTAPVKICTNKAVYKDLISCFLIPDEANYAFKMIHTDSNEQPIKTK